MADSRFATPGVDARFPGYPVDLESPGGGVDGRFTAPGTDTRFMGGYGGVGGVSRAQLMLANETDGLAIVFTDVRTGQLNGSMQIKDTVTPANNFIANATTGLSPFSKLVFTRGGNGATRINEQGVIEERPVHTPRIDYDPFTLQPRGFLIEPSVSNLLLNSLIDGSSLVTQNVTVAAANHTLSFYGAGRIILSGAYSATLEGSGPFPNRVSMSFMPVAGVLTVTVQGSVNWAQLEDANFPTSFIPTAGVARLRGNEVLTLAGTLFNLDKNSITLYSEHQTGYSSRNNQHVLRADDGTENNRVQIRGMNSLTEFSVISGGVVEFIPVQNGRPPYSIHRAGLAAASSIEVNAAVNGILSVPDPSVIMPAALTTLRVGTPLAGITGHLNGWIREIMVLPRRMTAQQLQARTYKTFAPINTLAPVLSGVPVVGEVLTTTTGEWFANPPPTFTYQWFRDGLGIGGAAASTYQITSADIGALITTKVSGVNSDGTTTSAPSNAIGPITEVFQDLRRSASPARSA
jgi:hypothetical protein